MSNNIVTSLDHSEDLEQLTQIVQSDKPKEKLVFFVGAGISMDPPSHISSFPQRECLKNMRELDLKEKDILANKIRPEVFFQVLYNHLGKQALNPLQIINPKFLNDKERLVYPNYNHYFLAKMLNKGHIVLTTNFDNLIEEAYSYNYKCELENIIIYQDDFKKLERNLDKLDEKGRGFLLKIHGSFVGPGDYNTEDSIIAVLEQVQKEFPHFEESLLNYLFENYNWVVFGQSARDDYDLFTILSNEKNKEKRKKLYWVKHDKIKKTKESFKIENNISMRQKLKELALIADKPENNSLKNIYSVLTSYEDNKGFLIYADTTSFLNYIWNEDREISQEKNNSKINKKISKHLSDWAKTINLYKREYIFSDLYKLIGKDYLDYAIPLYYHGSKRHEEYLKAKLILMEADTIYRKEKYYHIALRKANQSFDLFEEIHDIQGMAEAKYTLGLICNRIGNVSDGINYASEAVNNYILLSNIDSRFKTNLAQSLRLMGLISFNIIPDIYDLEDGSLKRSYDETLNYCMELCNISEKIFCEIGNVTGERGINQTLNVQGLILLRKGEFFEAAEKFKEFIRLSDSSRLLRESFQGYRNFGICLYKQNQLKPDNDLINQSIQALNNGLICQNIDSNQKNIDVFENRNVFSNYYNFALSLIESEEKNNKENGLNILNHLNNDSKLNSMWSSEDWHWKCNILARICKINADLSNVDEAKNTAKEMFDIYRKIGIEKIKKQRHGPKNYSENVIIVDNSIDDIYREDLPKILEITSDEIPFDINTLNNKMREAIKKMKS